MNTRSGEPANAGSRRKTAVKIALIKLTVLPSLPCDLLLIFSVLSEAVYCNDQGLTGIIMLLQLTLHV